MITCCFVDMHATSTLSKCSVTFQGRLDEADPLFERSLAIWEKVLGPDHPNVAASLNNRAELLQAQVSGVMYCEDMSCGAL